MGISWIESLKFFVDAVRGGESGPVKSCMADGCDGRGSDVVGGRKGLRTREGDGVSTSYMDMNRLPRRPSNHHPSHLPDTAVAYGGVTIGTWVSKRMQKKRENYVKTALSSHFQPLFNPADIASE